MLAMTSDQLARGRWPLSSSLIDDTPATSTEIHYRFWMPGSESSGRAAALFASLGACGSGCWLIWGEKRGGERGGGTCGGPSISKAYSVNDTSHG